MNRIVLIVALLGSFFFRAGAEEQRVTDSLGFSKAGAVTPAEILRGRVSGVRVSAIDNSVNGALNTHIRGVGELRGDSQPLWIVNGVQLNSSLNRNIKAFWQYGESAYTVPLNPLAFLNPYDIESIEVIKDLSATALYGAAGANGVIIIKTRMNAESEKLFSWDSNVSIGLPGVDNDAFSTAVSHNHSLSLSGTNNNATWSISGYFRDVNGVVENTGNTYAGLNVNFETRANAIVWFGLNSISSLGTALSTTGTAWFGAPSMMLAARYPALYPADTVAGWKADYDDEATDYRTVNSVYLTLNFTPWLSLKTTLGADLQNHNRYFWYGIGTSFGAEENGANSILASSMFNYNASSVLTANRFIGDGGHHVVASLGVEAFGEINKFNTMNGTDFFSHVLRNKSLTLMGSKPLIHKFVQEYGREAAFATAAYDWNGKAGVNASLRADFTRRYYDWNPVLYPAVEAFADVKKLALGDIEAVSSLKVTAGFGKAGRERFVPYGLMGEYCSGEYPVVAQDIESFYEGMNRVQSRELNVGFSSGFLGDRFTFAAKFYDKVSVDGLDLFSFGKKYNNSAVWHYTDRSQVMGITSSIANRGFEFDLKARVLDTSVMKWDVWANAAYNVNQVIAYDQADLYGKVIGDNEMIASL